jgi:hypothetical protein
LVVNSNQRMKKPATVSRAGFSGPDLGCSGDCILKILAKQQKRTFTG